MVEKLFYTSEKMTGDQFAELIADCHFPEHTDNTWVLAEQIPDRVVANPKDQTEREKMLLFKRFKQGIHFENYSSGRIFREDMEIRWEKLEGKMHVVYLGTEEYMPVLRAHKLQEKQGVLEKTRAELPKFYYLFGERLKEEDIKYKNKREKKEEEEYFAEVRIPQLLLYPIKPGTKPYVCLQVCEYINAETGIVELFRFQKLQSGEQA
jgi:hypothetical protein